MFRRMILGVAVVWMLGSVAGWSQAAKTENSLSPELVRVRAALEKYQDPILAIHDGYLSTLGCANFPHAAKPGHEPYPQGAMGIHFFNPALVGPKFDPMRPQVLLYEPEGGKLRLVGAEWFVPAAAVVDKPPELFGHKFWGPMEGHEPLMPTSPTIGPVACSAWSIANIAASCPPAEWPATTTRSGASRPMIHAKAALI